MPETEMTTYRNADGSLIDGEFGWVGELDFWDEADLDEPTEVVKQVWICQSTETIRLLPTGWCDTHALCCYGEHDEDGEPL